MKGIAAFTLAAALALGLAACNDGKVYDSYRQTSLAGWEKTDTLFFGVPRLNKAGAYQPQLSLRITDKFPFTSLTLIVDEWVIHQKAVAGTNRQRLQLLKTDTLNCKLSNWKGFFNGQGVSNLQYSFPMGTVNLLPGDSLLIRVRHDMKRETMPGVSDVGVQLFLQKSESV